MENNQIKPGIKEKLIPFCFCLGVFLLDQLTKTLVVKYIPIYTVKASFFGDFLRIIHVRNLGAAFSIGGNLPETLRKIFLSLIPFVVLVMVVVIYFRNNEFTKFQRWMICGIAGGGFGNVFDRVFRAEGVVDFIDFKFYGLFGFQRFPTFNVADSFVCVCGVLLLISFLRTVYKDKENKQE